MSWLRLYTDTIHDSKIRRLSPEHRWLWITVLCLAKESPEPGVLKLSGNVSVTFHDLQDASALPLEVVEQGMFKFLELDMVSESNEEWSVVNWNKRQYVSDNSYDRVKKYRKNKEPPKKNKETESNETFHDRYRNVSVTDQNTEYRVQSKDRERENARDAHERTGTPTHADARAHAMTQIVRAYEETFGVLRGSPQQLMYLVEYLDHGMDVALVIQAIHKSSHADAPMKYADGILRRWQRKGIKTVADAVTDQEEESSNGASSNSRKERSTGPNEQRKRITQGRIGKL
jgi:DnaD/phage-associated family protein